MEYVHTYQLLQSSMHMQMAVSVRVAVITLTYVRTIDAETIFTISK